MAVSFEVLALALVVALAAVVASAVVAAQLRFAQLTVGHAHAFANLASALAAGLAVGNENLPATVVFGFAGLGLALVLVLVLALE